CNELGEAVVILLPHFVRHHRLERRPWDLDAQIQLAPVPFVDDEAIARTAFFTAHEETRDLLDRLLSSREADAKKRRVRHLLEPFEAEGEVRAATAVDHRVNIVNDNRSCRLELLGA